MTRKLIVACLVVGTLPFSLASEDGLRETIRRKLEMAGQPALLDVQGESVRASTALPSFYERRAFLPAWSHGGLIEDRARELLDAIRDAKRDGLRPEDYHLAALEARTREVNPGVDHLADTDLLLTDAFLLLAAHLVSGRVDPFTFDPQWIAHRREVDLLPVLNEVTDGTGVARVLDELRPKHRGYDQLRRSLDRYRAIKERGSWDRIADGPTLKVGVTDPRVVQLRRRLLATGDLEGGGEDVAETFDEPLADAVVRFQRRHGLDEDGAVGSKTRQALNVSAATRVRQIELNLERWRWLPQDLGERHLLVNVPGFSLKLSERGEDVLSMRVIVGRAVRKTPVFSDVMRYLVFSPSWTVPPTILRVDKLPAFRKNPELALEQGFRVLQSREGRWVEVDPLTLDWNSVTPATIQLRQKPGPKNALGLVKFMFPNAFSVYLHDTPARELFAKSRRDFSSGCIRVERPAELAHVLLRDDPTWTPEAVRAAMESGEERSVTLPRPIPVHIEYWTAWAGPDGAVEFREDIYERDAKLDAALRLPPPD